MSNSRLIGPPTHYSAQLDERGQPMAGTLDSLGDDVGGALPDGWDDQFWQWQPAGDPAGAWVQQVDKRRAALWAEVKRERASAMIAGLVVLLPDGSAVEIDSDEASANLISRAAHRLSRAAPRDTFPLTLADDTVREMTRAEMAAIDDALTDHHSAIHARSQQVRAALFSPDAANLADLAKIDLI